MSKKKQKERKARKRKEEVKSKLLRRRKLIRESKKLENELWKLKKSQEEKLIPFRKEKDDTQH